MERILFILIICTVLIGLDTCSKDKSTDTQKINVQVTLNQLPKALITANNAFGFDIFKTIIADSGNDKNIFISPLSLSLALAMTYNGANGTTKSEMKNTLHLPELSDDDINGYFQKITIALNQIDPAVNLIIANSIWYSHDFSVLPAFIKTSKNYYDAQVQSLDFSSQTALATINNWVSNKTNKFIPEVIDQIDPSSIMFLINAIFFKGDWKSQFANETTQDLDFTLTDASVIRIPTMQQVGTFNYFSNEMFSAVEMPYNNGDFTMLIILPNEGHNSIEVASMLSTENWDNLVNNFSQQRIAIALPKFKFNYNRTMNNDLKSLGMPKAFSSLEADFSNINPKWNIYISLIKHNSYVEVNESGTVAAAVSTVILAAGAGSLEPLPFHVNKPFLFAIRESTTNAILFIGKVSNPK